MLHHSPERGARGNPHGWRWKLLSPRVAKHALQGKSLRSAASRVHKPPSHQQLTHAQDLKQSSPVGVQAMHQACLGVFALQIEDTRIMNRQVVGRSK